MHKHTKAKDLSNQLWLIEPVSFQPEVGAEYRITSALDTKMTLDISQNP
jgi:hypothetical protein